MAFGRAITRLRRAQRMKQPELANAMKTLLGGTKWAKQSVISELENGKTPAAVEDVVTFAAALGRKPGDVLMTWAEELGDEQVAGALTRRARTLSALDELQGLVRQASAEFLVTAAEEPSDANELAALVAELMQMPKRQRRLLFKLVRALQSEEDVDV